MEQNRVMRRFATFAVILGLLLSLTGATRRADANSSPQLLPGILKKMEAAHANLKSLRAGIVQEKHNVQIDVSDTDYGTLIYKPGAPGQSRLRIDYTKPDTRVAAMVGDNFIFYQPRISQAIKSTISKAAKGRTGGYAMLAGLLGSIKMLKDKYNIEYAGEAVINGQPTYQLHLVPKGKDDYASVEIWVNNSTSLLVQQKLVERNGDYMLVKLTNLEQNIKLPDDAFVVKYPKDTKIVDKF